MASMNGTGDPDAMVALADSFMKKKDKKSAARWYRLAEKKGRKEVGLTWVWKEKYDD